MQQQNRLHLSLKHEQFIVHHNTTGRWTNWTQKGDRYTPDTSFEATVLKEPPTDAPERKRRQNNHGRAAARTLTTIIHIIYKNGFLWLFRGCSDCCESYLLLVALLLQFFSSCCIQFGLFLFLRVHSFVTIGDWLFCFVSNVFMSCLFLISCAHSQIQNTTQKVKG
eukprot:834312_1